MTPYKNIAHIPITIYALLFNDTVMKLRELQENFVRSVLEDNAGIMADMLNTGKLPATALMGIYRNNTIGGITHAMQLTYPVMEKLVGEDFFKFACLKYIEQHKPVSGNLDDYGGEFADFLANFPPAQGYPYFPDVAKLEWLFHLSSIAEKAEIIDQQSIAEVPQEKYFNLHFTFHPSVYFLSSKYPVHKIWQVSQDGNEEELDITRESGVDIMLARPEMRVEILEITPAELAFLRSLKDEQSFYTAYEAATAIDEEFDLALHMQKYISGGIFSGFSVG